MSDNLVNQILKEDAARDKAYPDKSLIEDKTGLLAAKVLGRITDKLQLARQFIELIPLHYDQSGVFWMWDQYESYWKIVDELDVLNWVEHNAEANVINSKERTEILNALKLEARRKKPKEVSATCVQFKKEIVDIATGDRFIATPEYFVTNPIPHKIGKNPETPKFDKLFASWVPEQKVPQLYEIIAYSLIPSYPIERVFCLHGSGSNGKSVYRKIVRTFLGDKNVCSTSLDVLMRSRFETTKLYKKLLCEMGETNMTRMENTEIIKKLVSGKDLIGGEFKNKGLFDFINYAKLLISTNNLPPTEDKTTGFYRRWLIIDFPNEFQKEVDILSDITEEDYEALACKCLFLLDELFKRREFTNEGNFEARREAYEERSNPFDKFFTSFVSDDDPNADIPVWEFEKKFNEWLRENRLRAMSDVTIARLMKMRGIEQQRVQKDWFENDQAVRKNMRCWVGVRWK